MIHKLRWNEPLCKEDLDTLEKMLVEAGVGTKEDLSKTREGGELGLFVQQMVGMYRKESKPAGLERSTFEIPATSKGQLSDRAAKSVHSRQ